MVIHSLFECKILADTSSATQQVAQNAELAGNQLEMSGNSAFFSICVGIPLSASQQRAFMSLVVKSDPLQNDYMLVFCPKGKVHSYEK